MKVRLRPAGLGSSFVLGLHEGEDLISAELLAHGIWEPYETSLVVSRVGAGKVFVDVGANIGYYALLASCLVGETGSVYAFEPEAVNYRLLQLNCASHPCSNLQSFNLGLSNRAEEVPLFLSADNRGDHRIFDDEGRPASRVQMVCGDEILSSWVRQIDFLKIDTQGAETYVLQGLAGLIGASRHALDMIVEFWPYGLLRAGSSARELAELLGQFGLDIYLIDHLGHRLIPVDCSQLIHMAEAGNLLPVHRGFVNLFLTSTGGIV